MGDGPCQEVGMGLCCLRVTCSHVMLSWGEFMLEMVGRQVKVQGPTSCLG